jgi:hypothetical protein
MYIENLTSELFKNRIFNYKTDKDWKLKTGRPVMILLYADWSVEYKLNIPVFEEIAEELGGHAEIFKVNIDSEGDLLRGLGIDCSPGILFIPVEGTPRIASGTFPKESIIETAGEILFNTCRLKSKAA